jgi:PAS domain S-box-containing protein
VGGRDVGAMVDTDGHRVLDSPGREIRDVLAVACTRCATSALTARRYSPRRSCTREATIGAIAVTGRRGLEPWDESDLHLLATVANEAAVVLKNVELFSQLERERARLEAESTKLGDIVNAASDGIALIGRDGEIQAWNDAMGEVTGVAPAEAVGHPWYVSLRLKDAADQELLPEGEHVISDALEGHRHSEAVAIQVLRRDGRWRWLRVTLAPVLREDAEPVGTVLVARDVTSEREIEELKSDFIATVSHELRTPLTPLKGFLTTLVHRGDQMGPDQLNPVFSAMQGQVDRLERLIADLLVIADLDRGAITLERAHIDVGDAIRHVVGLEGPDRVVVELAEPVAAVGDDDAVRRVLRALVSNAVKHTDGRVRVGVERRDDAVLVHVDDDGPGVAPWDQERIFKRFGRLGDHLTRTQGPGLGLPIARALAQRMGGDVEVVSDVDRGSRFTVRLPVARPRAIAPGRDLGVAGAV